jgi:plastocyanin
MLRHLTSVAAVLVLAGALVKPATAQTVHEIRLSGDAEAETYAFAPATVTARAGDVLVFKSVSGGQHGVVFESAMPAAARAALNAAMPRRVGDLSGPLLGPGAEYRIVIPSGMPAGRYRFFCLPHRAYDEVGYLVIR